MRVNFGFFGIGRCRRISDITRMSIPFVDPARSLLTTCQIYVLMRTRTSVTANKALMNSERYRIIAARHAFAATRMAAYVWLTEYRYRYTAYSLHMRIRRPAMCTSVRHAYLRIFWRREYHRPNEV